jgi:hypothetical protein
MLKENRTGRAGLRIPSGASLQGEMKFLRSEVQAIEILKLPGHSMKFWIASGGLFFVGVLSRGL